MLVHINFKSIICTVGKKATEHVEKGKEKPTLEVCIYICFNRGTILISSGNYYCVKAHPAFMKYSLTFAGPL